MSLLIRKISASPNMLENYPDTRQTEILHSDYSGYYVMAKVHVHVTDNELEWTRIQNYTTDGLLPLSSGFLRGFFLNKKQCAAPPILQIHSMIPVKRYSIICAQATLSDGMHFYTECFFSNELRLRLHADNIVELGKENLNRFPIIVLKRVSIDTSSKRPSILVSDYELLFISITCSGWKLPDDLRVLKITRNTTPIKVLFQISRKNKNAARSPEVNRPKTVRPTTVVPPTRPANPYQTPSNVLHEVRDVPRISAEFLIHETPESRGLNVSNNMYSKLLDSRRTASQNTVEVPVPARSPVYSDANQHTDFVVDHTTRPKLPPKPRLPRATFTPFGRRTTEDIDRPLRPSPLRPSKSMTNLSHDSGSSSPNLLIKAPGIGCATSGDKLDQAIEKSYVTSVNAYAAGPIVRYANERPEVLVPSASQSSIKQGAHSKQATQSSSKWTPLSEISENLLRKNINVIGIVIRTRTNQFILGGKRRARTVTRLLDSSNTEITWYLLGGAALNCSFSQGTVIEINQAFVQCYQGEISLLGGRYTEARKSPEVEALRERYIDGKKKNSITVLQNAETEQPPANKAVVRKKSTNDVIVALSEVPQHRGKQINVLAVIVKASTIRTFLYNDGTPGSSIDIELLDGSLAIVKWILWNDAAKRFDKSKQLVVKIEDTVVKESHGVITLNDGSWAQAEDFDDLAVVELLEWYEKNKNTPAVTNISRPTPADDESQSSGATAEFKLDVVSLRDIPKHAGGRVDILAVVDHIGQVFKERDDKGKLLDKRVVQLVDQSCTMAEMILFEEKARSFSAIRGAVIGIVQALVQSENGSWYLSGGRRREINPQVRGQEPLIEWYKLDRERANIITL